MERIKRIFEPSGPVFVLTLLFVALSVPMAIGIRVRFSIGLAITILWVVGLGWVNIRFVIPWLLRK